MLWLWHRLTATARIRPLAWEPPHTALKRRKTKQTLVIHSFRNKKKYMCICIIYMCVYIGIIIISNSKGSAALGLVYNSWELNFNSPCLLHPCSPLTRQLGHESPSRIYKTTVVIGLQYCFALKIIDVKSILMLS